ncbi:MAG: PQQ-dependent dehydrogenase, methanol/ethanol family [Hyphomonadaceae bacterium]
MTKRSLWIAALCALALAACGPRGGVTNPDGDDWPSFGGDWTENHFSPLDQINDQNVSQLGLAWSYDIEVYPTANSAPLEVDGVMYFAAGYSVIHALNAATGELLWQYDPQAPQAAGERMRGAWGVRGIAYWDGKIYTGTVDGRLIALDARTGRELWSVMTVEPGDGRYISGPPWVFNGLVAIGHGGGDFAPVRGYVTAYDANTGAQRWRFHTVPGNPADGFENEAMRMAAETWTGEWWRHGGGGTVWHAMAYDPRYNRIYIGTGNGAPWNQHIRSPGGGDNLFLCSIVALDADTGEYVWHYQVNPGETWDFNAAMDIELADLEIEGSTRYVILHAPKNGFFYVIDREDGSLISAEPFVENITWAERIDTATGRPVENAAARYPNGEPAIVFPSPVGAHSAEAMSFSPRTGLVYIPAIEQGRIYIDPPSLQDWTWTPGHVINNGNGAPPPGMTVPAGSNRLLAWDPVAQREAWSVPLPGAKNGGVLSTGGNLVFQGTVTGHLVAYAADSGREVWRFDAQTGILAQPISYRVGDTQYVSVITSWRMSGTSGPGLDWDYRVQRRRVLTFALNGAATLPPLDRTPPPLVDDPAFRIDAARAQTGSAIFAQRCSLCHGPALVPGGSAPDLRRSNIPTDASALRAVLHDGILVPNGMPRFEDLTDEQMLALQHYIRQQTRVAVAAERRQGGR